VKFNLYYNFFKQIILIKTPLIAIVNHYLLKLKLFILREQRTDHDDQYVDENQ